MWTEALRSLTSCLGLEDARVDLFKASFKHPYRFADQQVSMVADSPMPFEFSVSGRDSEPTLRLLTEACVPGEALVSRCIGGVKTLGNVLREFHFLDGRVGQIERALAHLFPGGEEFAGLRWPFGILTAMRLDQKSVRFRCYCNLQWRQWGHRLIRIQRSLEALGLSEAANCVPQLAPLLSEWSAPVGVSFDFVPHGIRPARIHFSVSDLPVRKMLRLLYVLRLEEQAKAIFDFVEVFDSCWYKSKAHPLLLSVGVGSPLAEGSVKCDLTLRDLPLTQKERHEALEFCQRRFGSIPTFNHVKHLVEGPTSQWNFQYLGLTLGHESSPYLNAYYGLHRERDGTSERTVCCTSYPTDKDSILHGLEFLGRYPHVNGAIPMEAFGLPGEARRIPDQWPDIYMTCLVVQELLRFGLDSAERTIVQGTAFIQQWSERGLCRYLPDYPYDSDDSAMAAITLSELGLKPDGNVFLELRKAQGPDGGFHTFWTLPDQFSHPAVSLNVVSALDRDEQTWDCPRARRFLMDWLSSEEFPRCPWFYSEAFPLYLAARTDVVWRWLGASLKTRLSDCLGRHRRADGLWGASGPEVLDTALAVLCLARLGNELEGALEVRQYLRDSQMSDGGWCWAPLYSDSAGTWFGSRVVTTVFAIRALKLIDCQINREAPPTL